MVEYVGILNSSRTRHIHEGYLKLKLYNVRFYDDVNIFSLKPRMSLLGFVSSVRPLRPGLWFVTIVEILAGLFFYLILG